MPHCQTVVGNVASLPSHTNCYIVICHGFILFLFYALIYFSFAGTYVAKWISQLFR